jgi:hypothetical protein
MCHIVARFKVTTEFNEEYERSFLFATAQYYQIDKYPFVETIVRQTLQIEKSEVDSKLKLEAYFETLKFLISSHGIDMVDDADLFLRLATQKGTLPLLQFLFNDCTIEIGEKSRFKDALKNAADNGHEALFKELMEYADVGPGIHNDLPLRLAARNGFFEMLKQFCTDQSDFVIPYAKDDQALRDAASRGHYEIFKFLTEQEGVDVTSCDNQALWRAASNGHLEIVKLLFKFRGVYSPSTIDTALEKTALNGHIDVIKYLLNFTGKIHKPSATAVLNAIDNHHNEVTKILVEVSTSPRFPLPQTLSPTKPMRKTRTK